LFVLDSRGRSACPRPFIQWRFRDHANRCRQRPPPKRATRFSFPCSESTIRARGSGHFDRARVSYRAGERNKAPRIGPSLTARRVLHVLHGAASHRVDTCDLVSRRLRWNIYSGGWAARRRLGRSRLERWRHRTRWRIQRIDSPGWNG
jgi:hypothetical protein